MSRKSAPKRPRNANDESTSPAPTVNDSVEQSSRTASQRMIVERRAAHFARAEQPAGLVSSTPTGVVSRGTGGETEYWPGPFATAHKLIEQRNEAKKAREEAIASSSFGQTYSSNDDDVDEYDTVLRSMKWTPSAFSNAGYKNPVFVSTLQDICVSFLARRFDEIDDASIGEFSLETRAKLAAELSKSRTFSGDKAVKLAASNTALCFPECSTLSEDDMIQAIEKVTSSSDDNSVVPLKILKLRNCGHSFTDRTSSFLSIKAAVDLEALELTGLYRLNEGTLCTLLQSSANSLKSLNLTSNSRLGMDGMRQIVRLSGLTCLVLDHCTTLTDEHVSVLGSLDDQEKNLPALRQLSLMGLILLTDDSICRLLRVHGPNLTSFRIGGCAQLTDKSLMSLRESCSSITELDLSGLVEATTAALIGLFVVGPESADSACEDHSMKAPPGDDGSDGTASSPYNWCSSIGHLELVQLQGLGGVTDDVVVHMSILGRGVLRTLNLGSCHALSGKAAAALKRNCAGSLEVLDVSFVRGVPEDCMGVLIDSCESLKSLSVWGCTQLTSKFFNGYKSDILQISGRMSALRSHRLYIRNYCIN